MSVEGIVVFFSTMFAAGAANVPYCETCNQWTTDVELFNASPNSIPSMLNSVRENKFHLLKEQMESDHSERLQLKPQLDYCDNCKRTGLLALTHVTPEGDKVGTDEELLLVQATVGASAATLLRDFEGTVATGQ